MSLRISTREAIKRYGEEATRLGQPVFWVQRPAGPNEVRVFLEDGVAFGSKRPMLRATVSADQTVALGDIITFQGLDYEVLVIREHTIGSQTISKTLIVAEYVSLIP